MSLLDWMLPIDTVIAALLGGVTLGVIYLWAGGEV